jgi:formate dehydrogenase maturation protein FdhE
MTITLNYHCPNCDDGDNEAEINITSGPLQARLGGLPEDCSPGEAAEWELVRATCQSCGFSPDAEWFTKKHEDEIQELASETPDDEPEYDEMPSGGDSHEIEGEDW